MTPSTGLQGTRSNLGSASPAMPPVNRAGRSLLEELCAVPGVAGFEQAVGDFICAQLQDRGIEFRSDALGNVIARIRGGSPRMALVAHMDEVGLIVRRIDPQGFLLIERVGGMSTHTLPGQHLQVWSAGGALPAVAGALPQHLNGTGTATRLDELYLDIGVHSSQAALDLGVEVGLPITYMPDFKHLGNRVTSKALDDRAGCFLLLELAQAALEMDARPDLYLVFVVQEETLLRGAEPAIAAIQPDWVVGVDATLAFDTPDLAQGQTDLRLGGGAVIKVMDHIRGHGQGFIAHQGLRRHLESLALQASIPFQREVVTGLSTAVSPLPYLGAGLPTAAISFALRYSHSPIEVADFNDLDAVLKLLVELVHHPWLPGESR